jgi:SDR family mycofactocin-dependent oxidoreductase
MAGLLEGKVALVSGAARGQGRSHAVRLAEEGAEIIAFDICHDVDSVLYPLSTREDLDETVAEVEKQDRRIVAGEADVRDLASVQAVVDRGVAELGRLDIVCANAGIVSMAANAWTLSEEAWDDMIAVNLSGVWKTCRAAIPAMIEAGNGGSIAITSSTAGLRGMAGIAHHASSKHGVVGLARTLAHELAPYHIRVNTVSDRREHAHGGQRGDAGLARGTGGRRDEHREPAAGADARSRRHLQRDRVAGLRPGPVRDGRRVAGRCRLHPEVSRNPYRRTAKEAAQWQDESKARSH